MASVTPPDLAYSGLYYRQLLQDLLVWRRVNVPEITDEDPNEPFNQLLRAFALVGHYSNVLIDHVAREALLPTARLKESARALLSLIGYALKQPTAATVDVLLRLASPPLVAGTLPAGMRFATQPIGGLEEVVFEGPAAAVAVSRGDQLTSVIEFRDAPPTWTDRTALANVDAGSFTPWLGIPTADAALYLGHDSLLWDKITIAFGAGGVGDVWGSHVWEYYDGQLNDATPTAVVDFGGGIIHAELTSLLGASNRAGATVRVRCLVTGQYEDVVSWWDAGTNYATTGALGQAIISETASDYIIGTLWKEPANLVETYDLHGSALREITFDVPETTMRRWQKTTIEGVEAYWMRLRVVNATLTSPEITRLRIDARRQYRLITTTQGQTARENPAGSATGLAGQAIISTHDDILEGSLRVFIDEGAGLVEYVVRSDLFSSVSTSRDVVLDFDDDGHGIVIFGDGVNGRIPPAGNDNITLEYRYGGKVDGNIGAGEVKVIKLGSPLVASATNPRSGSGWKMADGATAADLERVKIAGPASLRTMERALTLEDVETLALDFVAANGTSPVTRAIARADILGPGTVELIVVGSGGGAVPVELLTELDTYFNGDPTDVSLPGRLVLGHELTSVAFVQRVVNVTLNVTGTTAISAAKISAAVQAHLSPTATETDGTYVHALGGLVYRSRLAAIAFAADVANIDDVIVVVPAANVDLDVRELPVPGTITVNIV